MNAVGTFEQWFRRVDKHLQNQLFGCGVDDIPDRDYYAYYDAGWSAKYTAQQIAQNEISGMGMDW